MQRHVDYSENERSTHIHKTIIHLIACRECNKTSAMINENCINVTLVVRFINITPLLNRNREREREIRIKIIIKKKISHCTSPFSMVTQPIDLNDHS